MINLFKIPGLRLPLLWLLSACALAQPGFQQSIIATNATPKPTVLSVFLGQQKSATLLMVTADAPRRIKLYEATDGTYAATPGIEYPLGPEVVLVDTGKILTDDAVILFSGHAAWRFNPQTGERVALIQFSSLYGTPVKGRVPQMDFFKDLNDDGLDDFIIPSFEGFEVSTQNSDGTFHQAVKISAPPLVDASYNNFPWYQPKNIFLTDMNMDGRKDLVVWVNESFRVYVQDTLGRFAEKPVFLNASVSFQYDSMESMNIAMRDEDQSDAVSSALFQVADLTGDGISDLLTLRLRSAGVFKKTTTYELYPGTAGEHYVEFASTPTSLIRSNGYQFEMEEHDFNTDGQTDVVISAVDIGIGKILAALVTGSVKIDLNFYQMHSGAYAKKPNLTRQITATFSLSSGDVFYPSVLIADVDGDAVDDLLIQKGFDQLRIFLGTNDEKLFSRKAIDIDVVMPNEPEFVSLVNLNNDGKQDLIIRRRGNNGDAEVVLLVSE